MSRLPQQISISRSNSKRGSRWGSSPEGSRPRRKGDDNRMKMLEIIETMKLILKIGGYGCLIIVVAIVFVFLAVCLIELLKS